MKERKGIAALILAKGKPKMDEQEDESTVDPLMTAAEEVMEAMESKDPVALMESMKSFVHLCQDSYSDSDEEM